MIQRIQTIFMLLAAVIASVLAFSNVGMGTITVENMTQTVSSNALLTVQNEGEPIKTILTDTLACWIIVALICLISIFLYKNLSLQSKILRLAVLGSILATALSLSHLYIGNQFRANINFVGLFTAIAVPVLCIMAILQIKKDQKLLNSLNRLR